MPISSRRTSRRGKGQVSTGRGRRVNRVGRQVGHPHEGEQCVSGVQTLARKAGKTADESNLRFKKAGGMQDLPPTGEKAPALHVA